VVLFGSRSNLAKTEIMMCGERVLATGPTLGMRDSPWE